MGSLNLPILNSPILSSVVPSLATNLSEALFICLPAFPFGTFLEFPCLCWHYLWSVDCLSIRAFNMLIIVILKYSFVNSMSCFISVLVIALSLWSVPFLILRHALTFLLKAGYVVWVIVTEVNRSLEWGFVLIWIGVRLCLIFVVIIASHSNPSLLLSLLLPLGLLSVLLPKNSPWVPVF